MLRVVLLFLMLLLYQPAVWAGAVNINTATALELESGLDGIGQVLSRRIVEYRQHHGPFRKPEDLQNVAHIGIKTIEKNRHRIRVDS